MYFKFHLLKFLFLPLFILVAVTKLYPQLAVSNQAYFCGFEDPLENAEWTFDFGSNTSRWEIGNALSAEGDNSLYISADGGVTAGFDGNPGYVAVYRDFILNSGRTYEISFEWINPGSGKLYVCWIDPSSSSNPPQWSGNSALTTPAYVKNNSKPWVLNTDPETGVFISADTLMNNSYTWQKGTFTVGGTGVPMRLLFFWMNDTGSSGTGAAIDNVQIGRVPSCGTVSGVVYNLKNNGEGEFSWDAGLYNPTYDFKYMDSSGVWIEYFGLTSPSVTVPDLPVDAYMVWIRMHCNDYTTIWYMFKNLYIHKSIESCLDYLDIGSENVHATWGSFSNPYLNTGVVNYGPESGSSRVTVHSDLSERDPRTGFQLETVPDGNLASVRLGNWQSGANAESITYYYTVDSLSVLMLLKYAVVMENPGHNHNQQPKFELEIFDFNDYPIGGTCGYENFVSGDTNTLGWERYGTVLWKHWGGFGLNLQNYIGERIKIRLTTYDCSLGAHYGYAYFTLDCARAEIAGVTCGDNEVERLIAPDGYAYEWFPKYRPDSIVSIEREFQPLPTDTGTYVCRMTYKGGDCSFELEANITPRTIIPEFEPVVIYKDCQAEVKFSNTSYTLSSKGDIGEVERFYWEWNDGYTGTEKDHERVFDTPGKYWVDMKANIAGGKCFEILSDTIIIPDLSVQYDTIKAVLCEDDPPFEFNNIYYSRPGVYEALKLKSVCDCDSIIYVDLQVNDKYDIVVDDDLLLYKDEYHDFNGKQLTEPGIYIDTLISVFGCDSIITLNLSVYPVLIMELVNDSVDMCETTDGPFTLEYIVRQGNFTTYSLLFDEDAIKSGFENQQSVVPLIQDLVEIPVPSGALPGRYKVELVFEDYYSGNDTLTAFLDVNYPSAILVQKWNDVIAILNAEYNGGYTFSQYQWYKDGELLPGETKSYLYVEGNLDFDSQYMVRVTRLEDGVSAFICPIRLEDRTDISVYPTIVRGGETITVILPHDFHMEIWDIMGMKVSGQYLHSNINTIQAPVRSGVYLMNLKSDTGEDKVFTIMVK